MSGLGKFGGSGGGKPAPQGGGKFGSGGKFGGGSATPTSAGGRFAPAPEPEDDGPADEPPQRAPQGRFGRTPNEAPKRGGQGQPQGRGGRAQGNQRGGRGRDYVPGRGRYTGTRSKAPRPPWLEDGKHLCEVIKTWESYKEGTGPRFFIQLKIVQSNNPTHEPGELRTVKYNTDDRAFSITSESIYMFVRSAAGFASDEEAVEQLGEEAMGSLMDAAHGNPDSQAEIGPNGEPWGVNPLAGTFVWVQSSRGNTSEDGQIQFYEHDWSPAEAPF